jgi:hypothetical protein
VNLHLAVRNTPERAQDALRTTLQDHFKAELAMPTATNRSRVLAGIHRAIEALGPERPE